ncbi:MAG: DUF2628 domain-containing protein [Clostridia bacterium]|nr:DUF2628 domain-containing protein [Clostridia bacterium]
MEKHICTECGTENEKEYTYCKNCGAPLNIKSEATENAQPDSFSTLNTQNQTVSAPTYSTAFKGYTADSIDGVSREEFTLFIGRKAVDILPKLSKMELTHSKISWCWPAGILGFLFGPLGSALWFFYRKMYKNAFILAVIGTVITVITSVMTVGISADTFDNIIEALMSGNGEQVFNIFESLDTASLLLYMAAGFVSNLASILSGVLCGLFGYYFYKEYTVQKIQSFRTIQGDQRFYRLGLASIGGVSGGMLTLGIVILISVNNISSIINTVLAMIL